MKKNILFLLFAFLFLSSCISSNKTNEAMYGWLGKTKHKLLLSYGPPDKESDDAAGGEILIYIKNYSMPFNSDPGVNPFQNSQQQKMYFINPDGIVYHFLVKYQELPPTQVQVIR
jgi:hypothetical protein